MQKRYFPPQLQILSTQTNSLEHIGYRGKPYSLCYAWTAHEETPWQGLASGLQPMCLLAGADPFRRAALCNREGALWRNTDFINQSDSARFHLSWISARSRHVMECLCRGWHFNDLISLGRIFLWVGRSIRWSTEWSCYMVMNFHYLPWPETSTAISAQDPKGNLVQSS